MASIVNPALRGWINYYGRFYKSALYPPLRHLDRYLTRWVMRKYKGLKWQATGSTVVGAHCASPALAVCPLAEPESNGWMMGAE
nr:group II intron maturase-specific domain-containing protein [Pelagibius litoralis]